MMISHILKFVEFTKTQKSRERNIFFFKLKNLLITHQGLLYGQKYFCSRVNLYIEVTFKNILILKAIDSTSVQFTSI